MVCICQIDSSACGLMILFSYCLAIPDIKSAEIPTMKNWLVTLHFLLIVWLNIVCVNTFLVILFGFVAFFFRWLRVLLSPFAPDHIQQSLFHRKGRFTVLGNKLDCTLACDVVICLIKGEGLRGQITESSEIIWLELVRILLAFVLVHICHLLNEERMEAARRIICGQLV